MHPNFYWRCKALHKTQKVCSTGNSAFPGINVFQCCAVPQRQGQSSQKYSVCFACYEANMGLIPKPSSLLKKSKKNIIFYLKQGYQFLMQPSIKSCTALSLSKLTGQQMSWTHTKGRYWQPHLKFLEWLFFVILGREARKAPGEMPPGYLIISRIRIRKQIWERGRTLW